MTTTEITTVRDYLAWRDDPIAKWLVANGWQMPRSPQKPEVMWQMGECYANSMQVGHGLGWDYCEGYAVSQIGIPLMHAWCLEPNNVEVMDVTWRHECQDFFGVIIPRDIALEIILRNDVYGVLPNLWKMEAEEADDYLAQIAEANKDFRATV